jgi:cytochrome P450
MLGWGRRDLTAWIVERGEAAPVAQVPVVTGLRAIWDCLLFFKNPIRVVERQYRRNGPVVAFKLIGKKIGGLLVVGARYNREVLNRTDVARPTSLWQVTGASGSAQAEFRRGYLGTQGKEHETLHSAVASQLTKPRVEQHFAALRDLAIASVDRWPTDQTVDLYALNRQIGSEAAFKLLFGEPDEEQIQRFVTMLEKHHLINWQARAYVSQINVRGCPYHAVQRNAERLAEFISQWIAEQRHADRRSNLRAALAAIDTTDSALSTPKRMAGHFSFLGFAAYETMSSVLTWILFLLALHPNVLADLVDEIEAGTPLESVDSEELKNRPLLNGVIQESMRLVPPVPVIPWRAFDACEVAGLHLQAGTKIMISPHLTHRLPELFADPLRFLPERWFSIKPSPYEYLPFSGGPRRCPGAQFGTEFLRVALTAITRRYRVELGSGARIDYVYRGITMPKPGIPVTLAKQDRRFRAPDVSGSLLELVNVDRPN